MSAAAVLVCFTLAGADRGAMARSLLLPGWGQAHLGYKTRSTVFMGVEAATWLGAGLSCLEAAWERDNYRMLALQKAGIDVAGRDRGFQDNVGSYMSSDDYNVFIRRLARYYYPDDPEAQQEYYRLHSVSGESGWNWSGEAERLAYRDALRSSREWYRRTTYIAMFAVVNRVVSAIDAALLDPAQPGVYTGITFPEAFDNSSVLFTVGARF
ncbi:MAG TPA: hypothetical protein PK535_10975 [Synergistaceae bacterium]|nr:hypothetical protein [Synergistaceae bacterium]